MSADPKIIIVLPAYNAARTLEKTYLDIPREKIAKIILVDDVSQDQTVEVARSLGLSVVIHIQNRGYGGNQKTCYIEALKEGADVVVMLHPDHQYDSKLVPELVAPILKGEADMVMGSRILNGRALQGGMPFWKFAANRVLTKAENIIYRTDLTDCHSGFRAYSRSLLSTVPFLLNSDDFVFDSQMIAQAVHMGFKIKEVAVQARYFPEASSVNFRVSTIYGIKTVCVMLRFLMQRLGLIHSRIFERKLTDVVSRHHHETIFRVQRALFPMTLHPGLKAFAERILPRCVVAWLDPVQDLIESEVRQAAERLAEGHIVLDAGAGEARHGVYFKRGRYIALDAGYGDSTWDYSRLDIRGDLERIPLVSNSVDCILCMVVLEHTRNPELVLREFARILKPEGTLVMVVPFLWEEHQAPHDYFRFTRYGVRALFESTSLRLDLVNPIGGFFWVCARRSVGLLSFFQSGWRWIFFALLAPFFGLLFPLLFHFLDRLDTKKNYSLGFQIHARKSD